MSLQDKISSAKPNTFLTDGLSKEEVKQAVDEGRMSDTVKLIIEIPKDLYDMARTTNNVNYTNIMRMAGFICSAIANGTPLANDSERAEVQAYFAGKTYGWKQATAEIRAEIVALAKTYVKEDDVLQLLDNMGMERSEDRECR